MVFEISNLKDSKSLKNPTLRIILDLQIMAAFVYINGRLLSVKIVKLLRQYESLLKF